MKKGPSIAQLISRIQRLSPSMGGVFSFADLSNLISTSSTLISSRTARRLVKEGVLFKIQRGYYVTPNPDLWVLASRLKRNVYISMDSILAKNGLVGSLSKGSVSAIMPALRSQTLETPFGILRFFSIKKDLVFGTKRLANGVNVADSEKAYLDLLYYYAKGARFVFDPLQEVAIDKFDRKKLNAYLKKYSNPKFVQFVKGTLHE